MDSSSFIREAPVISLDSYNQTTKKNPDGSIDIYLAPQAPAGQENNWVTTARGSMWSAIFRLYGLDKPFFDKTWQLPDFKQVAAGESETIMLAMIPKTRFRPSSILLTAKVHEKVRRQIRKFG